MEGKDGLGTGEGEKEGKLSTIVDRIVVQKNKLKCSESTEGRVNSNDRVSTFYVL